ncbi:hypothetical protein FACS1894172_15270 [Spirochaetia bacterium]|nr:hypothetical protein FACS1894164_04040 [Spirochaetia bacterium]GHU34666.1 hypothetical protein FACS1894172_15270 [Spirochaetia bacterium]
MAEKPVEEQILDAEKGVQGILDTASVLKQSALAACSLKRISEDTKAALDTVADNATAAMRKARETLERSKVWYYFKTTVAIVKGAIDIIETAKELLNMEAFVEAGQALSNGLGDFFETVVYAGVKTIFLAARNELLSGDVDAVLSDLNTIQEYIAGIGTYPVTVQQLEKIKESVISGDDSSVRSGLDEIESELQGTEPYEGMSDLFDALAQALANESVEIATNALDSINTSVATAQSALYHAVNTAAKNTKAREHEMRRSLSSIDASVQSLKKIRSKIKESSETESAIKMVITKRTEESERLTAVPIITKSIEGILSQMKSRYVSTEFASISVPIQKIIDAMQVIKNTIDTIINKRLLKNSGNTSKTSNYFEEIVSEPNNNSLSMLDSLASWKSIAWEVSRIRQFLDSIITGAFEILPEYIVDTYAIDNEEFIALLFEYVDTLQILVDDTIRKLYEENTLSVGTSQYAKNSSMLVIVRHGDTADRLANKYLGSADFTSVLLEFNGLVSFDDVQPGDILSIPEVFMGNNDLANRIYDFTDRHEPLGRDIALDELGNVKLKSDGVALVTGTGNISQAILLRLRENVTKRIRLQTYGIITNIGNPLAGINFITGSIYNTVMQDPRVKTINDIQFTTKGDIIDIFVRFTTIQGNVVSIKEKI